MPPNALAYSFVKKSAISSACFKTVSIEVKPQYFEQIPIPEISTKEQMPFITLVDKIIAQKQKGENSSDNEKKIDKTYFVGQMASYTRLLSIN